MSAEQEASEFSRLFKSYLKGNSKAALRWVVCSSVDWSAKTMECTGSADDLAYYDVALGFGSVDTKPAVNSNCLIAIVENQESVAFMIYTDDAELIQYNGGDNKGLIIYDKFKTEIDKLTARVDMIVSAIKSATVSTDNSGATLLASLKSGISTINANKENFSEDILDSKITH